VPAAPPSLPRRRRGRLAVATATVALVVMTVPSCTSEDRPDHALAWRSCEGVGGPDGDGYECATLRVPLDWDRPGGRKISLAVARHRADGRRVGSLVINPGGPGGSGLDFLFSDPLGPPLSSRFDVVSWDPRGVGASTAFVCDDEVEQFLANDPDPDTPQEQFTLDADANTVASDCGGKDYGLSANVGTDAVARDMEAIRVALGESKLTYLGFSYGTLIGLRYLDLFGARVRAMVLDGVIDPTQTFEQWLTAQTIAVDAVLERVFAACDADDACAVDDMAATFDRVQRRIEQAPMPAGDGRTLGPAEFETGAVFVSYEPSLWADLDDALDAADTGDGGPMMDLAQGYYDFGGYLAYAAVECLDSRHPTGAEEFRAFADRLRDLSPRIGGSVANELLPCAYWPAPPDPITGGGNGPENPPILVVGNRGDAATPYENSVKVADMLDAGVLVSYDGEGHTSYGRDPCVDRAVNEYLIRHTVPHTDPDC
jgi:pimeloyl-ACP methyl ester carboxylesterase